MASHSLDSEESRFFSLIADAIFSNPFSTEYETVAGQLREVVQLQQPPAGTPYHAALAEALEQRLARLETAGIRRLQDLPGRERELFEYALLFRCYHRHHADFDALIQAQQNRGLDPVPAPFANGLMDELLGYGFGSEEALKYLSLFYQLRRAFHFIDQGLVGQSRCMKALRHALWNNVFTSDIRVYGRYLWGRMEDFSTLLLGETGTGKGAAAAAIGRSGPIPFDPAAGRFKYSFAATFIATNLSRFPESLIESELFGHRKGAFTGAIDNHQGIFERCSSHGALFLDEIGDVSLPTQLKLLNVLQERTFTPVGSHREMKFEGRVIAATNRSLDELRQVGRFRDDFYYRLCSDVIEVPSLRRRLDEDPGELERLGSLLIRRLTRQDNGGLLRQVIEALQRGLPPGYPWPGNVRELEQAVRRIILNGNYLPQPVRPAEEDDWMRRIPEGTLSLQQLTSAYCRLLYRRFGTYEEVARRTGLDRRTAKKYAVQEGGEETDTGPDRYVSSPPPT